MSKHEKTFAQNMQELCDRRHPFLRKKHFGGGLTEQEAKEFADIEAKIDRCEMDEYAAVHRMSDRQIRRLWAMMRILEADFPDSSEDDDLPQVEGGMMERSVIELARACRVLIADEQDKVAPDEA